MQGIADLHGGGKVAVKRRPTDNDGSKYGATVGGISRQMTVSHWWAIVSPQSMVDSMRVTR